MKTTYETVIGLEVHAQLLTQSKMFCSCNANYANAIPNTHVCPVCLGMPGVLPVINKKAIEYVIMTALALNCSIPEFTKFDRKNYPYPDLMKGYQISQYDLPLSTNGWMEINTKEGKKRIGITRVHLEEDTARLLHRLNPDGESYSLVDVNRSGTPLMEVVGEPDIRSPEDARQYLIQLRSILQYLGVCTGNMEDGSFRCDANISIRPASSSELMTKVEIKNMNSFKAVYNALDYEIERQQKVVEDGGSIVQETRGWDETGGITVSQRSKEHAHDYRYFPEPDLPPLVISKTWVQEIKSQLPELPEARYLRFIDQYSLSDYDASLLTIAKTQADYFENCVKLSNANNAKTISNWITGEFARLLNATDSSIENSKATPQHLVDMIRLIDKGILSTTMAKAVFEEIFHTGNKASQIVEEKGLKQISESGEIDKIVEQVLADNTKAVSDVETGKEQAFKFLVGQVMKVTKGRANPQLVNNLIKERLGKK